MPYIIILTGHPCSGKTTLANQIRERALLKKEQLVVDEVVIVDDATGPAGYATAVAEKAMRGALKSAFDRAVATAVHDETKRKTLIILDSTNYIKGFRYELFCIGKAATSSYCVVWCLNDIHVVKEWNTKRRNSSSDTINSYYSDELLDALILRYEPPDERNRWDQPLYRIDVRPPNTSQQEIAGQLLNQSVYNMHNLAAVISQPRSDDHPSSTTAATGDSTEMAGSPPQVSATFKRSAFQKKTTATTLSTKTSPMATSLTAEALSALNTETSPSSSSSSFPSNVVRPNVSQELTATALSITSPHHVPDGQPPSTVRRTVEEQIDDFLIQFIGQVRPLKESTSTRQHRSVEADVLHTVDFITQQLCTSIIDALAARHHTPSNEMDPDRLVVPFRDQQWYLDGPIHQVKAVELRRIRQEYLQWMSRNPIQELQGGNERGIVESFLAYIATQIRR